MIIKIHLVFINIDGNINQGAWILTQSQIIFLHEKCNFLHQNEKFCLFFLNYFRCYFSFIIVIIYINLFLF
jgi:hypothetical protein